MNEAVRKQAEAMAAYMTPDPAKADRCIFCGAQDLTDEHFWPDWMAPRLSKDGESRYKYQTLKFGELVTGASEQSPTVKVNGPLRSQKPAIVCHPCNNEWMSGIEKKTKSLLEGLCWDGRADLSVADQLHLATWLTLKTITGEYNFGPRDGKQIAIRDEIRERFKAEQAPFEQGWQMHLAAYKGTKSHRHRPLYAGVPGMLVMQTSIWCGSFFATIINSAEGRFLPPIPVPGPTSQIWPPTGEVVRWNGRATMDDRQTDLAHSIVKALFVGVADMKRRQQGRH